MQGNIIFYTTGCSKCAILKRKLDEAGISYTVNDDVVEMQVLGLTEAPALEVDGKMMGFGEAVRWVNEHAG